MSTGLRTKIVLIATAAVLLAIGAIMSSTGYLFKREYSRALESRSLLIATNLKIQLERILQFGIKLENLAGFDEQAAEIVKAYEGIAYALVTDPQGAVLFTSSAGRAPRESIGRTVLDAVKLRREIVVPPAPGGAAEYNAVIPVLDRQARHVASIVVGFPEELIADQVNGVLKFGLGAGLVAMVLGMAILLGALSLFVTGPLTRLIGAIEQIRRSADISLRVGGKGKDEIGMLMRNFNGMLDEIEDRAKAKAAADAEIHYHATHDLLTGLPNRNLLADRLAYSVAQSQRKGEQVAVLFLDLDRFKLINDSFGHAMGDELLKAVGARLAHAARASDTVARLGGDEFVIVLTGVSGTDAVQECTQRVLDQFLRPFEIGEHTMHVSASVGISMYPADADTGDLLLRNADASMYRAKDEGRNCARFYTQEMSASARQRVALEAALHEALQQNELDLHYQPIVDMQGTIIGVEALLRWTSGTVGTVAPESFIPVAEETGLIAPIGEWVMRTACAQLKAWHAAGLRELSIAVNLSVRQIELQDVPGMVGAVLRDTGVEAKHLELELTESALMRKSDKIVGTLFELNRMGVRLSLDDFGTGYSSLSYLRRFPLDSIKIDRSFIDEVTTSPDDAAISKAIIAMAHSLGIKTIAEGVETERQMEFLKAQHCHAAQGNLHSAALPSQQITALLLRRMAAAA